jgi:hypothetical protein
VTDGPVDRGEFEGLESDHRLLRGRVVVNDAMLYNLTNAIHEIRTTLLELKEWKDDSKVQQIAALRGIIKRRDRVRDIVLCLLGIAVMLEALRVLVMRG